MKKEKFIEKKTIFFFFFSKSGSINHGEMISTIFKTISCKFKILFLYSKYLVDYLKENKKNNKKRQIFVSFLINC